MTATIDHRALGGQGVLLFDAYPIPVPPIAISSLTNSLAEVAGSLAVVAFAPPFGRRKGAGHIPVTAGWLVAVPVVFVTPLITVLYWVAATEEAQALEVSARAAHQL